MGTDIHSIIQYRGSDKHSWRTELARVGDDRNYNTFAILANVRNGAGFAGVVTGEEWPFIAEPRGIPEDMFKGDYPDVLDEDNDMRVNCPHCYGEKTMWLGDHSHSYVTLAEMKKMAEKLEKIGTYKTIGVLSIEQYEELIKNQKIPTEWSGWISGGDIRVYKDADNLHRITAEDLRAKKYNYIQTSWFKPIKECILSFYNYIELMEKVRKEKMFGMHHAPTDEDVRLIFGFDS